jgi:hypothetical protein
MSLSYPTDAVDSRGIVEVVDISQHTLLRGCQQKSKQGCLPLASLELVVEGLVTSQIRLTTRPHRTSHSGRYMYACMTGHRELGMRFGMIARV